MDPKENEGTPSQNGRSNNEAAANAAIATEQKIEQLTIELEGYKKENGSLKATVEVYGKEIENLTEANKKLSKKNEKLGKDAKNVPGKKETFELDGKKYEILAGANVPGIGAPADKMTPLDIAADPEAQAILVKINSGIIREIK